MKKLLYLFSTILIVACNSDDNNDVIAPIVTLIGESSITVSQYSTYVDAGATASDDVDGDLTANIETTSDVDTNTIGTYTVTHSVSNALGNVGSASRQVNVGVPTPIDKINVLWQSPPAWDSITAMKVATINPAKLIISISGGINPSPPPSAGPSATQLIQFITYLTTYGYTGELVMHPDVAIGSWLGFWSSHPWDDVHYPDPWKLYIDYYKELNIALHSAGQKQMTELLIETGKGTNMNNPFTTTEALNDLFTSFKTYMNDIGLDPSINKLSATGAAKDRYFPSIADHYYAQMYDMGVDVPALAGINIYSPDRVNVLVTNMIPFINLTRLDKVCYIFTYADTAYPPSVDAPMFGETAAYWNRAHFTEFVKAFKIGLQSQDSNACTGVWWMSRFDLNE
ncbi:MAG: DUF5011 domain-containing protein [Flavobacteriaceae bacterium]|jgi:hypothetical protein|nr:DUF5011 domain-containing protein [Flavobacteriaceae bacterium]MBT3919561.1 DUF5011 domain-containing protein [Flavobacteriaceae bacterium]MBT6706252.1 DUF5011 domain-containing protein [Flavobacteriaceae bacterium]MBT7243432.1 DUF5011 domain-containing protein [Flavobacteriaceae bacterium]